MGIAADEAERVVEIVGRGHRVGVVPHRVTSLHAACCPQRGPEVGGVPRTTRAELEADQRREHLLCGAARSTPTSYGPVSYTHLRAHETVLDLVCRLLLEKKK